jgi:hypothetical protein
MNTKPTDTTFTHNSITINGKTFPAEYTEHASGDLYVMATVQEGGKDVKVRIKIDRENANYIAAQEAARQARVLSAKPKAKRAAAAEPVAEPVAEPAAEPTALSAKPFVGTEIAGEGWKIRFDAACGRTRVILQSEPSAALREAIEKAGFFWSDVMKSWNKKLTVKAYKAAQALALDLRKLCA